MNYSIYIVADSRGAFLQRYLDYHNSWPNVRYTVEVYKGRGILQLWARARKLLLTDKANFVYLFGGICDLTSLYVIRGQRKFWIKKRPRDQLFDLQLKFNSISEEARRLDLYGKLSFFQEMGCDLLKYNRVVRPQLWMIQQQKDMDEWLPMLQKAIKELNYKLGVQTPWVLDCIYKHTNDRRFYPRYFLLHDGLHPTQEVASKIAFQVNKDVGEAHE